MDSIASFGAWVQQRRRALRLTQDELARLVGCSRVLIRKIEADERRPSAQMAGLLARHLRLPVDQHAAFVRVARAELAAFRLPAPDVADHHSVARLQIIPAYHLPTPPDTLIGRDSAIAAVLGLVHDEQARLVTLIGPPGIGKTRLALAAAHMLLPTIPDGAWFVDLAPVHDPALALPAIAGVLGIHDPARPALELIIQYFRHRRSLLVLDNLEQILAVAPQIAELLANAPGLTVLATSRAALRLRGEYLYAVPPLDQATAIDLFTRRARAVRPDFALTEPNRPLVARIVARLDGLPLAIELAAARMRLFSLEQLRVGLATRLPLLTGGPRDAPARQQTLRDAVAWSYELLSAEEQAFFRRLGVFVGGWTAEAAEAVTTVEQEPSNAAAVGAVRDRPASIAHRPALASLETLLDQSLITREGERFGMLETLREYALEQLTTAGEEASARRAHAAYFLEFAERSSIELDGPEQRAWFERLSHDQDNLRAALRWSLDTDAALGLRMAGALWSYWGDSSALREARAWLTQLLERAADAPLAVRARAFRGLGICVSLLDDNDHADVLLQMSVTLYQSAGDRLNAAYSMMKRSLVYRKQSRFELAHKMVDESLPVFEHAGFDHGIGWCWFMRGLLLMDQNVLDPAWNDLYMARARFQGIGDHRFADWIAYNLGHVARLRGDPDLAEEYYQIALAMLRIIPSPERYAEVEICLGHLARLRGDYPTAQAIYCKALITLHEHGNRRRTADTLDGIGSVLLAEGRSIDAARLMGASAALREWIAIPIAPAERPGYERQLEELRAALAEPALGQAWESGRTLTLDQAVELALRDREHRI